MQMWPVIPGISGVSVCEESESKVRLPSDLCGACEDQEVQGGAADVLSRQEHAAGMLTETGRGVRETQVCQPAHETQIDARSIEPKHVIMQRVERHRGDSKVTARQSQCSHSSITIHIHGRGRGKKSRFGQSGYVALRTSRYRGRSMVYCLPASDIARSWPFATRREQQNRTVRAVIVTWRHGMRCDAQAV